MKRFLILTTSTMLALAPVAASAQTQVASSPQQSAGQAAGEATSGTSARTTKAIPKLGLASGEIVVGALAAILIALGIAIAISDGDGDGTPTTTTTTP